MDLTQIVQIVGSSAGIIITIIIAIIKIRNANTTTEKVRIINKYAQIIQQIPEMIKNAETSVGNGNGALKKTLVLQQIQLLCAEKGIDYKNEEFSQEIEKILETPQKKDNTTCTNVNNNSSTQ